MHTGNGPYVHKRFFDEKSAANFSGKWKCDEACKIHDIWTSDDTWNEGDPRSENYGEIGTLEKDDCPQTSRNIDLSRGRDLGMVMDKSTRKEDAMILE